MNTSSIHLGLIVAAATICLAAGCENKLVPGDQVDSGLDGSAAGMDSNPLEAGPLDADSGTQLPDADLGNVPQDQGTPGADTGVLPDQGSTSPDQGPLTCSGTRDPAYWPFSQDSPWNTPLGSGAIYDAIVSPGFSPSGGVGLNSTSWSHPIFIAVPTDPMQTVSSGGSVCATLRVSASALPDSQTDGHLHLIDDQHSIVVETFQTQKLSNGDFEASACVVNSLYDAGVYSGWHGTRAYGGSAIAGLIRSGELTGGIPHALALATYRSSMNMNPSPFVWPASSADNGWQTTYATSGNLHMGSLLAIPPSVDVTALGLSTEALNIARALQDYGGYITDAAGANLVLYAEPAAAGEIPAGLTGEINSLLPHLEVVTNNTPNSVGGGGVPRTCLAPPFQSSP